MFAPKIKFDPNNFAKLCVYQNVQLIVYKGVVSPCEQGKILYFYCENV